MKAVAKEVGAIGGEGPPVPIPNTEVKLISAENTWLEAARENRAVPTQKKNEEQSSFFFYLIFAYGDYSFFLINNYKVFY